MPGGVLLPVLMLAADLGDLDAAMPFMDRRNAAPASMACNCSGRRPARPSRRSAAWDRTRSIWRVPTMPASSITSTSRT
jgi:hypothetical protein